MEIDPARLDVRSSDFSGGAQQRPRSARARYGAAPRSDGRAEGGLDVPARARRLDLLRGRVRGVGLARIAVAHDVGVVWHFADRVMATRTTGW